MQQLVRNFSLCILRPKTWIKFEIIAILYTAILSSKFYYLLFGEYLSRSHFV